MDQRKEPRFDLAAQIAFSGYDLESEGTLQNISCGGVKLETSDLLQPGAPLFLSLLLPDGGEPVDIELAMVRWLRPGEAGLEIVIMGAESRDRLAAFLRDHMGHEVPATFILQITDPPA